jgi:hypothetical protein
MCRPKQQFMIRDRSPQRTRTPSEPAEPVKAGGAREQIITASVELKGFPDHGALSERVLTAAYEELVGA